jgi:L-amino acid N-acyltransferase YncA
MMSSGKRDYSLTHEKGSTRQIENRREAESANATGSIASGGAASNNTLGYTARVMSQVRLANLSDAPQVAAIYAPYVISTSISFELEPPSVEEMERRIGWTLPEFPWLVSVENDVVLGYAYASEHRSRAAYQWSADVSVYVRGDARRRGIGKSLYRPLLAILRLCNKQNAYAGISLPNPASVRLHESMGFTPIGVYRSVGYKLGAWRDVGWWHLRLGDLASPPRQPLNMSAVTDTEELRAALAAGVNP